MTAFFALFLRVLIFYLIFIMVRGVWRRYKLVKAMMNSAREAMGGGQRSPYTNPNDSNTFDAEYRVVEQDSK